MIKEAIKNNLKEVLHENFEDNSISLIINTLGKIDFLLNDYYRLNKYPTKFKSRIEQVLKDVSIAGVWRRKETYKAYLKCFLIVDELIRDIESEEK